MQEDDTRITTRTAIVKHPGRHRGGLPRVIPRSTMNDAFEYVLPTEVARLMAAPALKTRDQMYDTVLLGDNKVEPLAQTLEEGADTARVHHSGSSAHLGSHADTQPAAPGVQAAVDVANGARGPPASQPRLGGVSTAPISGAAAADTVQGSLHAQSEEAGSTVVVAPYAVTQGSTCTASVAACRWGTIDGAIGTGLSEGAGQRRGMIVTLLRQLDCFGGRHLMLGRFAPLGRGQRRRGGVVSGAYADVDMHMHVHESVGPPTKMSGHRVRIPQSDCQSRNLQSNLNLNGCFKKHRSSSLEIMHLL